MTTNKALITYLPLAVGTVTATALVASYIENKRHIRAQMQINEQQRELNELIILEKKMELNGKGFNFRNLVDIEQFIPTKNSGSAEWCSYYNKLKEAFGKSDADIIFAKTWQKREGSKVDVNKVRDCTKLDLDRTIIEAGIGEYTSGIKGAFSFAKTNTKIIIYGGLGIAVIFLGLAAYKFVKSKPNDYSSLAGGLTGGLGKVLKK
jgi:hypothetical protein